MIYHMLALFSIRQAKTIILTWACFLVLFGLLAMKLPTVLQDHGLKVDGSYAKVQTMLSTHFHIPDHPIILLFEKETQVPLPKFHQFIAQTLGHLQGIKGLREIVSPLDQEGMIEGDFAYALLSYDQEAHEMNTLIDQVKHRIPMDRKISVKLTGKPVVQEDVNQASQSDLKKAEMIGIPIAFIVLWLSFGGFFSALLPVLIGLIGVTGTMGIMYVWGTRFEDLSIFVFNVIPMVGLALSIDFALMLVSRFREELKAVSIEQALITTMRTAGRAVVCSALCVFLGLGGMLFIRMPIFYTVAIGAMIVLTISLLLTLTLLPALLFMMGNRIQSEMRINSGSHQIKTSLWTYLSAAVMKRPVKVGLLASLILFWFILPLGQMNLAIPDASSLSKAYESRQAAELFDQYFTDPSTSQVFVMMEGEAHALQVEDWMGAYQIHQQLEKDPQVIQVDSVFSKIELTAEEWRRLAQSPILKEQFKAALTPFIQGNKFLMSITLRGHENSKVARDWVRDWERILLDKRAIIGGEPKYQQEVYDEIFENMDKVLLFIFVSNFLVLLITFRSILIPIKTIIMNLMSLGASFGILVWIFKEGHLGMEPSSIAIMIPVFIFGLTFGISMDYGVFLLSRIYEIYRKTGDNELSVKVGLALTSKMITSAATIMIVVTAPFALGTVVGVKQLGIGIAAAILIDATIIRMMLVPSLMKLLGRWNWWGP